MRVAIKLAIVLFTIALSVKVSAQQNAVIINLTEQTAYLLEDGRVAFVSPIASGKEGRGTPTGRFRVISKDLNHQSGNFRSGQRLLRQNSQSKRDSGLIRPPRMLLHACSDVVLHGIPQIRRDACGLSSRLSGIARLHSNARVHGREFL